MMRLVFFLAALAIVGLIVTGAITLTRNENQNITITIDKTRVKEDAAAAIRKGKEVFGGAESELRQAARDVETN